jgi:cytochrome c oxidase subunit I
MYFAVGLVSMFIIGGISGVMHASPPVDLQHNDTYFVVAHFHYVLFGGAIFGLFGGIYFWFPKFFGKMLHDGLGKIHFWLMVIGFNVTFFPMHWVGIQGMPRRIYTYDEGLGWATWNMVETIGTFVIALGFVVFIVNVLMSLVLSEKAPADPWDGATLEWSIPSPPPVYNFATVPVVTSRIPHWSAKYPDVYGGEEHGIAGHTQLDVIDEHAREHMASGTHAESHTHAPHDHGDEHGHGGHDAIHLPDPSYWPVVTALGVTIIFAGFLFDNAVLHWGVTIFGILLTICSMYAWAMEPPIRHAPTDHTPQGALAGSASH